MEMYLCKLDGIGIWLVDSPGFDDSDKSGVDVLEDIATWLAKVYSFNARLAGIIYLHKITDNKFTGSTKLNLHMFKKLCGNDNLHSVRLVTTHWTNERTGHSTVSDQDADIRLKELSEDEDAWGQMIRFRSTVDHHDNTKASAERIVRSIVQQKKRVVPLIARELVDGGMQIIETQAGQHLEAARLDERRKGEEKLRKLNRQAQEALADKDRDQHGRIRELIAKHEEEMENRDADWHRHSKQLKKNYNQATRDREREYERLEEQLESLNAQRMSDKVRDSAVRATWEADRNAIMLQLQKRETSERFWKQLGETAVLDIGKAVAISKLTL